MKTALSAALLAGLVGQGEGAKQVGQHYFNDCQLARHKDGQYLDRQLAQCGGSGRAMRNLLFGRFGCADSNYLRYRSGCTTSGVASQVETKYTSCQLLRGKRMQYLDRQQLRCSAGYALTDFVVEGCSGNDMRYKYHCTKLDSGNSVYTKQTGCNELDGKQVQYLDRHSLDCGNDFLSAMTVTRSGCSGNHMRYRYECTSSVATPPPPAPVSFSAVTTMGQIWDDVHGCGSQSTLGECSTTHTYAITQNGKYLTASKSSSELTMSSTFSECSHWRFLRASDVHVSGETPYTHFVWNECDRLLNIDRDAGTVQAKVQLDLIEMINWDANFYFVKKGSVYIENETTYQYCNNGEKSCSAAESFFGCKCYHPSTFTGYRDTYAYVQVSGSGVRSASSNPAYFDFKRVN